MASTHHVEGSALTDNERQATGRKRPHLSLKEQAIDLTCRLLRRLSGFRAYWLMVCEPDDIPDGYGVDGGDFEARTFRGNELSALTGKHRDLGEKFIARSIRKDDWCHAFFDGDKLISYGCCSSQPTMLGEHFCFEFREDYFYMYRGFTMPDYRGNRLNGLGMVNAIREGVRHGKRGFVGLIEVQNVPSLHAANHGGHRREGMIITFRLLGRWMTIRTQNCRRYGSRLVRRRETVKC